MDAVEAEARAEKMAVKAMLLQVLKDLVDEDFKEFKWNLDNRTTIQKSDLQAACRSETVNLLVQHYPRQAVDMTIQTLRDIRRNDLVELLSQNNAGDSLT